MNADDIIAIHQLMSLYGHYLDQTSSKHDRAVGRPLNFGDVFMDDIEFRYDDLVLKGREEFERMAPTRADADLPDEKPGAGLAHYVANVFVYEEGGQTRVHAKWFVPYGPHGGVATGDYHSVVVKTAAGWRIASVDARVRSFPGEQLVRPKLDAP